jgi:hypothetical protein
MFPTRLILTWPYSATGFGLRSRLIRKKTNPEGNRRRGNGSNPRAHFWALYFEFRV